MNKLKLLVLLLLLSHESSASLMQLEYRNFYAPPSPTNWPVDMTGLVSLVFDDGVKDIDSNPFDGKFLNPIKSGYMFLSGIRYDIDTDVPVEFTTQFNTQSPRHSSFRATGTMFNSDIGRRDSFSLYFGGDLLEAIGSTLANLDLSNCFENHLNLSKDDTLTESYEYGYVATEGVSVAEPNPVMLLILGMAAILCFRIRNIKNSF
ncbi:MAG: hypothetical protein V4660_14140 [Pseudomonadota bacterium]